MALCALGRPSSTQSSKRKATDMRAIINAIIGIICTPVLGLLSILPQVATEDGTQTLDLTGAALVLTAAISWTATLGGIWWLALSW